MTLGNGELTNADKSVHFARVLVAEQRGGFRKAHGQVAVGALTVQKYLILERAGHRAQRKAFFGLVVRVAEDEHSVQIVIPVTRDLIQLALSHIRRFGKLTAALCLNVLHPALKYLNDLSSLW